MMPKRPRNKREFRKRRESFAKWLRDRGSEIRETTNEYELARFTTPEGVGVVYVDKSDRITSWMGGADRAFDAYLNPKLEWRVAKKANRKTGRGRNDQRIDTMIKRDGPGCWYCGKSFENNGPLRRTIEHLISLALGGPDHIANMVLAHWKCNQEAENMSVAEKVALRERKRGMAPCCEEAA